MHILLKPLENALTIKSTQDILNAHQAPDFFHCLIYLNPRDPNYWRSYFTGFGEYCALLCQLFTTNFGIPEPVYTSLY